MNSFKKNILVVDDNGINRLLPGLILRPFGWHVEEVSGGVSAIHALQNKDYAVVLLDISMPDLSGLKVLEFIKSNISRDNFKVIAYTASLHDAEHLKSIGFSDVLIKPLTSLKLLNLIK